MVTIYYSERIQVEINKGKRHMEWSPGETRHKLLGVPFQWSHMGTHLILPTTHVKCYQPGKFTWALVCRTFIGIQSCMHVVPVWLTLATQISTPSTPEQKQAFTINHSVRMNFSHQTGTAGPRPQAYENALIRENVPRPLYFSLFLRDSIASM